MEAQTSAPAIPEWPFSSAWIAPSCNCFSPAGQTKNRQRFMGNAHLLCTHSSKFAQAVGFLVTSRCTGRYCPAVFMLTQRALSSCPAQHHNAHALSAHQHGRLVASLTSQHHVDLHCSSRLARCSSHASMSPTFPCTFPSTPSQHNCLSHLQQPVLFSRNPACPLHPCSN